MVNISIPRYLDTVITTLVHDWALRIQYQTSNVSYRHFHLKFGESQPPKVSLTIVIVEPAEAYSWATASVAT